MSPKKAADPKDTAQFPRADGENGKKDGQQKDGHQDGQKSWTLRLYIAGDSPRSRTALRNLERMCQEHLPGRHQIIVVDLMKHPELAKAHQILAIPTLIRELPEPIKRVIGDLSDESRVLLNLDVEVLELGKQTIRD